MAFSGRQSGTEPLIAWIADEPDGIDYAAVILARPAEGLFDLETIDGRVEGGTTIDIATSPLGAVRMAYHNGLFTETDREGTYVFFREEDEDEIFKPASEASSFDAEEDLDIPDFLKS